jgi:hypothetical protein
MIKLKNISNADIVLHDLGEQLLHPEETIDLDNSRKDRAANSSQIISEIVNVNLCVIDHDEHAISDTSLAIDVLKGFSQKFYQTTDAKMLVQNTPRPLGTFWYFSSFGDDVNNHHDVGNGAHMGHVHHVGDPSIETVYVDLNMKENKTYIQEGYTFWRNCAFDIQKLEIVPKLTPYTAGVGTIYNLYGGYLIVPAPYGDGVIDVYGGDIQLVEMPFSIDDPSVRQGPGFWNADYDAESGTFVNITPAPYGNGIYNMFGAEVVFEKIVQICMLGNDRVQLKSSDIAELGHGMRLKFTYTTGLPDHEWSVTATMSMVRVHTTTY